VAFRLVSKAIFDSNDRKRLYKEAREYLALRSKRKQYVKDQSRQKEEQPPPPVLSTGD
jgi:hypothetical protein